MIKLEDGKVILESSRICQVDSKMLEFGPYFVCTHFCTSWFEGKQERIRLPTKRLAFKF
jgi:hypothetical protein